MSAMHSPFINQSIELLSSSPRNRFPIHLDSCYEQMHELERKFCKDFSCCGLNLVNLHDLLEHYEEYHPINADGTMNSDDEQDDSGLHHRQRNLGFKDRVQNSSSVLQSDINPTAAVSRTNVMAGDAAACNASASIISATASPSIYHQTMMMMLNMDDNGNDKDRSVHPLLNPPTTIQSPSSPFKKQHLTTADLNMLENANKYASRTKVETLDSIKDGHNGLHTPTSMPSPVAQHLVHNDGSSLSKMPMPMPSDNNNVKEEKDQRSEKSTRRRSSSCSSSSVNSVAGNNKKSAQKGKRVSPSAVSTTSIMSSASNDDTEDRPYRCHITSCDKAYKNANGLKYHRLHGHCPPSNDNDEWDASRPYVCSLSDGHCRKRYKNLNGLKYHMEHTHGRKMSNLTSEMFLKQNEAMKRTEAMLKSKNSGGSDSCKNSASSKTATATATAESPLPGPRTRTRLTRSSSISNSKNALQAHNSDKRNKKSSMGLAMSLGCKRNLSATSLLAS